MNVPFRSQYDASPYQFANCGPASLAMVLQAYGLDVSNERLRAIADQLQGTYGYNDGIALGYLANIAEQTGLRTEGMTLPGGQYRQWTMGDVIREIRRGYPVITLVHYASLPDHASSLSQSDHYIVVTGVTSQGYVINDPAFSGNDGFRRLLTPDELMTAWRAASIKQQAVAFLPSSGKSGLKPLTAGSTPVTGLAPPSQPADPAFAQTTPPTVAPSGPTVAQTGNAASVANTSSPAPLFPMPTRSPNPTLVAWTSTLGSWQHVTMASPTPSNDPGDPGQFTVPDRAVVLADRSNTGNALPSLVVLAVIGVIAVAIIKVPGHEED